MIENYPSMQPLLEKTRPVKNPKSSIQKTRLSTYVWIFLAAIGSLSLLGYALSSFFDNVCIDLSGNNPCQHILFIGNSYTYVNDLPTMFVRLARSGGHAIDASMVAEGGWTLSDHIKSTKTLEKIKFRKWDYVVLQEQSQIPASNEARVSGMFPSARKLSERIISGGGKPIFFLTWGHRDGWPEMGLNGYDEMQHSLDQGYREIARQLNLPVAPVGDAWELAMKQNSQLVLWQEDGSHPTEEGTYLSACVFYASIFHQSPEGLSFHANLKGEIPVILQKIASETVLTNPDIWNNQ
jgi:hypothetical protein